MSNIQRPQQISQILTSALTLLENGTSWENLDFALIADHSEINADVIKLYFHSKADLYKSLMMLIDRRIEDEADKDLPGETPRDRLFELLMLRFDILNEHRAAYQHLFYQTFKDPKLFRTALPRFHESMDIMLRLADLNGRDGTGCPPLRTTAVAIVFLNAARIWLDDDSKDMAPTMAELDRGLAKLDQARDYIPEAFKRFV
jgi:AcrR family transcriptional regulator